MPWMLSAVLRNLFSPPATRRYPFEKREPLRRARGQLVVDRTNCVYCGACARICPSAAIQVDRPNKLMTFDPFKCIVCSACADVCPKGSLTIAEGHKGPAERKRTYVYSGSEPK